MRFALSKYRPLFVLSLVALSGGLAGPPAQAPAAPIYLRVNQVGYLPSDPKIALALTNADLSGRTFRVVRSKDGKAVFTGSVGRDRGAYGNFAHLYELDFSSVSHKTRFRLNLGGTLSPAFEIGTAAYGRLLASSLKFYKVQRCGDTHPSLHGPCHLKDGRAADGPATGTLVDVSGGWHDAGDYLKFLINTGSTTVVLLSAYEQNPSAFADGDKNGTPDVLDEARIGVDWIRKLWDSRRKILYYQVGDESDHEIWRMPEADADLPPRTVWSCQEGRGANVAGKAAAVLTLAAYLWNQPSTAFRDPVLAGKWLAAAKDIYVYGKARPAAQSSTSDFYDEDSWKDDLALAAAELYRATKTKAYLSEARSYAASTGSPSVLSYADHYPLARYEIARLDPSYLAQATALLAADLKEAKKHADAGRFRSALEFLYWGSATDMTAIALEAYWYRELSSLATFHKTAVCQRDFVLGVNPWGVCFVNGAGTTCPRAPHHQVADLTHSQLTGFWDEGPIRKADWEELGIEIGGTDLYAAFQAADAVYHDNVEDYGTNEPTINANAVGIGLLAAMLKD